MRDQFSELDVDDWLRRAATASHFGSLVDDAIEVGLTLLAAWYRALIQQQSERPSRVLLAFAEELMDTRQYD